MLVREQEHEEDGRTTPSKVNTLVGVEVDEEKNANAEEEYSNECSNYSEDDEDAVLLQQKDFSPTTKLQTSDTKTNNTNGSMQGDARSSAADRYLEEKKEVTYSAYGINLENSLKLLACSKNVNLVGKTDVKAKRMFITSSASLKE